jgi:hypothetical protein
MILLLELTYTRRVGGVVMCWLIIVINFQEKSGRLNLKKRQELSLKCSFHFVYINSGAGRCNKAENPQIPV